MDTRTNHLVGRPDERQEHGDRGTGEIAAGRRVLVAEDHPVNVDIMVHLLKSVGIQPTVVGSGRAAVDLVARAHWDLVLMDVQMPDMDGLEATRKIRTLPGCARLPIVALTAAGSERQRADCLEAGVSDFMAKPIGPAELKVVLSRWLPNFTNVTTTPLPEDQTQGLRRRIAPVQSIDFDLGLAGVGGMPQVFSRMLERFVEVHRTGGTRSMDTMDESDVTAVAQWMHAFRGPASLLGMTSVAGLAGRIERSAKTGRTDTTALTAFRTELDAFIATLTAALTTPSDTP